jgi:hypothetical protein
MKQRVILLPVTEHVLGGYRGLVGKQESVSAQWIRRFLDSRLVYYVRMSIRWMVTIVFLVVTLPLIIGIAMPVALLVMAIWGKKSGNAVFDLAMRWMEKSKVVIPFLSIDYPWSGSTDLPKPVEEDVPGFLATFRRQRYRLVLAVPEAEQTSIVPLAEEMIRCGQIDAWYAYTDDVSLTNYLLREDVYEQFSWIIQPYEEDRYKNFQHDRLLWISTDKAVANRYTIFSSLHETTKRIMFSRIMLPYNRLLDESVVLYFETEHHPAANAYLRKHFHTIRQLLQEKRLRLLYFPALQSRADLQLDLQRLWEYSFADLFEEEEKVTAKKLYEWVDAIDLKEVYRLLQVYFGIPEGPSPAFIHCVRRLGECNAEQPVPYSYTPLFGEDERALQDEIDYYIRHVQYPSSQVMFSLVERDEEEYDADDYFHTDGGEIAPEVKAMIATIKTEVGDERILETLFHIIRAFRDREPEVCRKLCQQLYEASPKITRKVSRIRIDRQFRIFLTDYADQEIEMTPLPKTLFLFMLKYPNGILFKELYRYKQELLYIYGRVSRRSDLEVMQKSIQDMTDARSNSINEKCSRIKEAFVSKIDERIAEEYFITGNRLEPKRIRIDRNLVGFEEPI